MFNTQLRENEITVTAAGEILSLDSDEQQRQALKIIAEEKMNTHELRHTIRDIRSMNAIEKTHLHMTKLSCSKELTDDRPGEVLGESILVLRIALIRLDAVISRAKTERLKHFLIAKRLVFHNLIDEFVRESLSDTGESPFERILASNNRTEDPIVAH